LLVLVAAPTAAAAQGFNLPYRTGSSFFQPAFGRYPGGFYGGFNPVFRLPPGVSSNRLGYLSPGGFYDPGYFTTVGPTVYYVPSFAGPVVRSPAPPVAPLAAAGQPPVPPAPTAQPAELRLEFPAPAEVWVDGQQQPGAAAVRVLTSPPVPAGGRHVFNVRATWAVDGRKLEWERAVPVQAGQRGKVTVAGGFPAKS
jgi:uncharacterized protein (TIGR03000 family)